MTLTDPLEFVWISLILLLDLMLFLASIFFLRESHKNRQMKGLHQYYRGMTFFFFCMSLNGFFDFFEQYFRYVLGDGTILSTLFPPEYQVFNKIPRTETTTTTFCIIITLLMLSFAILSYQLETYILQSKLRPMTIILLACFFISLLAFFAQNFDTFIQTILSLIDVSTLLVLAFIIGYWGVYYLVLAKRSIGSIRKKAILVALGIGFIMGGIIFDTIYRQTIPLASIFWFWPMGIKIVGCLGVPMLFYGFRRKDEF